MTAPIERASAADVMLLACDVGPAPMNVGAVLRLDVADDFDVAGAETLLAQRVQAIPRLRQRLVEAPFGCGRPVWTDDPGFDVRNHVAHRTCAASGDEAALLREAAQVLTRPLPASRPRWRAVLVTGLDDGSAALVIAFHHVLADGIGGLAVLAALVDGAAPAASAGEPVEPRASSRLAAPTSRGRLAADAWSSRMRAVRTLPAATTRLWAALRELGAGRPAKAARTSLNRPCGPRRVLATVRVDLASVRDAAHRDGGTVNDVVLAAVTAALHTLLGSRGESPRSFVVSVPVSARATTTATRLGNQAGVMPVELPAGGAPSARLAAIADRTRSRKSATPGASAALLGPAFRALAAFGVFGWFINHQRQVHTFVTNLRGPDRYLSLGGARIAAITPVSITTGNVTVAFGVLSYAGTLTITVIADPDHVPDLAVLVTAMERELAVLTARPAPGQERR